MFPIGFGFKPIEGYLLPWECVVEKQMYGENFPCEPWKVFRDIESSYHSKTEEKGAIKYTIYAFTTLLRASNSKRVSRRAENGTWGGQTGPKKIENSETGCVIGQSTMLVGHWTMHEYCLSDEYVKVSGRSNAADLVVCKITKTVKKVPYAQSGVVSIEQLINDGLIASMVQLYCGGYEAPIKRAAEVDLRNEEGDDLKRQKCHGKEFI
ncbi:hypothetical protein SASPL_141787 [Salvia splendens]|uniref:Uncharacterized protein n=1 Tax=Salvia splendens TaxID=180675 RepID=A0A8X8WKF9_SALSN|nr:hypothetical protein SASPL_141787 [Salvia splendens]